MFGIDSSELAIVALVALLVIGPKDLPRVMRQVGQWMAKGRAMTRHVRSGFDTMMREAELEEMQKAWAAQNDAIMKATAMPDLGIRNPLPELGADTGKAMGSDDWMLPAPPLAPEVVDVAATPTPGTEPATAPRRRRKVAADTPAADAAAGVAPDTVAAKAPRRRVAKKPGVEPQASDS